MGYTCIICLVKLFFMSIAIAICVTTAEICEDVDTTACERVKLIRPGMCSEPYMSKQCKRHCGNCRKFPIYHHICFIVYVEQIRSLVWNIIIASQAM